jgi:hypothetical protein
MISNLEKDLENKLKYVLCDIPFNFAHPARSLNYENCCIEATSQTLAMALYQLLLVKLIDEKIIHVDDELLHGIGFFEGDEGYDEIMCYPADSSVDIEGPLMAVVTVSLLREYGWTVEDNYIYSPSEADGDYYGSNAYFRPSDRGAFHEDDTDCLEGWYREKILKTVFKNIFDEEYLFSGIEEIMDFFKRKYEDGKIDSDDYGELLNLVETGDFSKTELSASIAYDICESLDLDDQNEIRSLVHFPGTQFVCIFHKGWQEISTYFKNKKKGTTYSEEIVALYDECCRLREKFLANGCDAGFHHTWEHDGKEYKVQCCYPIDSPEDGGLAFINPLLQINCGEVICFAKEFDEKVNRLSKMVLAES